MQRLEVSGVVQLIYRSLGVKGLTRSEAQAIYSLVVWELIGCVVV